MIRINYPYILIIAGLIGALLPIFKAWTGLPLYFPSFLTLLFLFFLKKPSLINERLIIYFGLLFTYLIFLHNNLLNLDFCLRYILPYLFIYSTLHFLLHQIAKKDLKRLAYFSFFIMILRSVTGIIVENFYPMAARSLTGGDDNIHLYDSLSKFGVGSYGYATGLIFIYPVLIALLKENKDKLIKICIVSFIIISIVYLIKTAFTTALIFSAFSILGAILLTKNLKRNILLIFFISITGIIINSKVVTDALLGYSKDIFIENNVITTKINEIEESILYDEPTGDIETRSYLYQKSINAFLSEPIFGTGLESTIGGHATWLDFLGMFGLLGTTLFILIFFTLFKKVKLLIPSRYHLYYSFAFILYFPLGFLKNCSGPEILFMMFLISPMIAFLNLRADRNSFKNSEQKIIESRGKI